MGLLSVTLVAQALGWVQPAAAAPHGASPAAPDDRSVPVTAVKPKPVTGKRAPDWRAQPVVWPTPASATLTLPLSADGRHRQAARARIGGLPVVVEPSVLDLQERAAETTAEPQPLEPASVLLETMDQAATLPLNVPLALRITRADGVAASAQVRVSVDYSGFRDAYGADWDSRLGLMQLPACSLTTPEIEECADRTWLLTANDQATGVVSADVDLTSTGGTQAEVASVNPAGGQASGFAEDTPESAVVALAASPSSDVGDFSKTQLSPSGSWQAGGSGGAFSWNYPLGVPPVPGGLTPGVSLGYSSAAVDGQTAGANVQPGWLGEGWSYEPGFIERAYRPCGEDNGPVAPPWPADVSMTEPCWRIANAKIVWNGRSTELIPTDPNPNPTPNQVVPLVWHLADDDGTKVEYFADGTTGTGSTITLNWHNERWKLTTKDGTQYWFGQSVVPGGGATVRTNSVLGEQVFSNHPGEPCHSAAGAVASTCAMAYRWNLDYVVDRHGNSMVYYYTKYTNVQRIANSSAQANMRTYDRAAHLARIEYGLRAGTETQQFAAAMLVFTSSNRCFTGSCTTRDAANYPDTPWDLDCSVAPCPPPSFWTSMRLSKVQTQVRVGASSYNSVDNWDLGGQFPITGNGTSPVLWLSGITRTGQATGGNGITGNSVVLPTVSFPANPVGGRLRQRAVFDVNGGMSDPQKYRINEIKTESGGTIAVTYAAQDPGCLVVGSPPNPDYNPKRCFAQWYDPPQAGPGWSWWHKYVVEKVVESDAFGSTPVEHAYTYALTASTNGVTVGSSAASPVLWHYDSGAYGSQTSRNWSDWRGYPVVIEKTGKAGTGFTQSKTMSLYFTGLAGDRTDAGDNTRTNALVNSWGTSSQDVAYRGGKLHEKITYDGDTDVMLSRRVFDDTVATQTGTRVLSSSWATAAPMQAWMVTADRDRTWTWIAGTGSWRQGPDTSRTFDTVGEVLGVSQAGDPATTADDLCTDTAYNRGATAVAANLMGLAKTVDVFASVCGGGGAVVRQSRIYYDQPGAGAPDLNADPTKGDVTQTDQVRDYTGSTANWFKAGTVTSIDSYGRPTVVKDALDRTTTTTFTETNGLTTGIKLANVLGHEVSTALNPFRGQPVTVTDANLKVTTGEYDKLGRLLKVWKPSHSGSTVDVEYAYSLTGTAAPYVTTKTLGPDGQQIVSYEILDGLLRPRETQTPTVDGKRAITETIYDSRGLTVKSSAYPNASAPSGALDTATADKDIPVQHRYTYDGAGRQLTDQLWSGDTFTSTEKSRTTNTFDGDRTVVDQPTGGTDTTTIVDALGRTTEVRQHGSTGDWGAYRDLVAADFTSDGKTDVMAVRISDGALLLYTGNADGTLSYAGQSGSGWNADKELVAGDFTSDGKADLAAVRISDGALLLYAGNGSGGFSSTTQIGSGWNSDKELVAGDFTSDGKTDVISVRASDGALFLYAGNGSGGFSSTTQIGSGWNSDKELVAGDFTSDGKTDVMAVRVSDGMLRLYAGNGTGGFASNNDVGFGWGNYASLVTGDFSGDSKADLYAVPLSQSKVSRYNGSGSGTFASAGDLLGYDPSTYTYDHAGQLTKVTDPAGNHWDYSYDLLGRKTKTIDPDAGTSTAAYDNAGQVTTTTGGRGQSIFTQYDVLGRKTATYAGTTADPVKQLTGYVYDTLAKGQLYSATRYIGGSVGAAYVSRITGYDDAYRPTSSELVIPDGATAAENALAGTYSTTATYKVTGAPWTTTSFQRNGAATGGLPDETLTYSYNSLGQLTRISSGIQTYIASTSYNYDGTTAVRLLGGNPGQQIRNTFTYDTATRLLTRSQVDVEATPESWANNKASDQYTYDQVGNVRSITQTTNAIQDQVQCYDYDYLRRMTTAWTAAGTETCTSGPQRDGTDSYSMAWTFGLTGNRSSQTTYNADGTEYSKSTYGYGKADGTQPHTLTSTTTTGAGAGNGTYVYDAAGNTINRPGQTLSWDAEGHLATLSSSGPDTSFVYDTSGNRLIRKDADGSATLTLPDGTEIKANAAGTVLDGTRYIAGVAVRSGSTLTWTITDHHGTGQYVIDPTTMQGQRRRSLPYGGANGTQPGGFGNKGFVGGTNDPTALTHLGAREYDSTTGRFISIDPIFSADDPQSWNGYAYANNNPATLSDPTGLRPPPGEDEPIKPAIFYDKGQKGFAFIRGQNGRVYRISLDDSKVNPENIEVRNHLNGMRGSPTNQSILNTQNGSVYVANDETWKEGKAAGRMPDFLRLTIENGMPVSVSTADLYEPEAETGIEGIIQSMSRKQSQADEIIVRQQGGMSRGTADEILERSKNMNFTTRRIISQPPRGNTGADTFDISAGRGQGPSSSSRSLNDPPPPSSGGGCYPAMMGGGCGGNGYGFDGGVLPLPGMPYGTYPYPIPNPIRLPFLAPVPV